MQDNINLTTGLKKLISSLQHKRKRDEYKLFIVEGFKLCEELHNSNYKTKYLILKNNPTKSILNLAEEYTEKNIPVYYANEKTFEQISDTITPQEILAVANFNEDKLIPDESFIALDHISDPGNIGTIIRTAEWFGFRQVILSESCADKYNPKLVRATMGSIFRMNIITGINFEKTLKKLFPKHELFGASLESRKYLESIQIKAKFGLIFGSESHGISENVRALLNDEFKIPGKGAESLNVAVSAGISMYYFQKGNYLK